MTIFNIYDMVQVTDKADCVRYRNMNAIIVGGPFYDMTGDECGYEVMVLTDFNPNQRAPYVFILADGLTPLGINLGRKVTHK